MGDPWSRVANSTIKKYIREEEVNVLRNRKLSAMLKKRGRITFNWSGTAMDWKVRYRRVPLTAYADGDTLTFGRQDRDKTATLDWRGYSATDSMTKGEYLMNRNAEAILKLFSTRTERLMDDVEDLFGDEFYIDGYAAANLKRMHGLESFLSAWTTPNATPGSGSAQGNAGGNGAVFPNVTNYAGLNTVPGTYGGTWTPPSTFFWPNGKGDTTYDFWSPLIVDVGDTLFSSTATWVANCVEAIAFAIVKSKKSKSNKGQLDFFMLSDEGYRKYLSTLRTKERIDVARDASKSDLVSLGFTDVVQQDGCDITWEYGVPASTGYGLNVDMMELRSQQAQVFVPEGPDLDIASKSWRWSIDFFGNLVVNPKFFVKLTNATTTTDPF